ncbi:MAG: FdtA/QdtA family cupin domain-containing protein [Clostridia bacterium]|nr:FdtA/QdtA family cupin domain-containing protein [Clostridia bacterium]
MEIKMINFNTIIDSRGALVAIEEEREVPFQIRRVYYIFNTQNESKRGNHAHKRLRQVLICISGSCKVLLDDGSEKREVMLDSPEKALIVENMIWHEMYDFSKDLILLVLADDFYNENDYIRSYSEFIELCKN